MQSSPLAPVGPPPEPATAEEAVLVAMVRVGKLMRTRHPGEEIDFTSLPLLKTLHHHGPMRVTSLAAALDLDASTVSRHAKGLEDRGLLERTGDPDDGRASRVAISAQGAACLEKAGAARRAQIAEAIAGWDEQDRETLRLLLHRLATDLTTPHPSHPDQNQTLEHP